MNARRALLRIMTLGLPAALLLAACKHWQEDSYSQSQQPRDGGDGSDGSDGGGGSGGY